MYCNPVVHYPGALRRVTDEELLELLPTFRLRDVCVQDSVAALTPGPVGSDTDTADIGEYRRSRR